MRYLFSTLLVLAISIGAILLAPSAKAINLSPDQQSVLDETIKRYNEDYTLDDVYFVMSLIDKTDSSGENYQQIHAYIFNKERTPNVTLTSRYFNRVVIASTTSGRKLRGGHGYGSSYSDSFSFMSYSRLDDYSSYNIGASSADTTSEYTFITNIPSDWVTNDYNASISYYSVSVVITPHSDVDPLITEYLSSNDITPTGAYFADSQGNMQVSLPLIQDISQLPADFSGAYCYYILYSNYYSFEVRYTPDISPTDFQEYWDSYLCIQFPQGEYGYIRCYVGSFVGNTASSGINRLHPIFANLGSGNVFLDTDFYNFTFKYNTSDLFYGNTLTSTNGNNSNLDTSFIVGMKWRVSDNLAAIPWTDISPMYLGLSYKHFNENGAVDEGEGSDDYKNYYDTYLKNIINTFTGTYTGKRNVDMSFNSNPLDTSFSYENDYTLTYDSNFLYLMQRCFDLDYITQMVVGVLAISFACYVIFGKMF